VVVQSTRIATEGDNTPYVIDVALSDRLIRQAYVTVADALHYLSLPRVLRQHPETGKPISANIGRFGPYIVHDTDFRSLKKDDVYSIELPRALEILAEPKKPRGFSRKKKAE